MAYKPSLQKIRTGELSTCALKVFEDSDDDELSSDPFSEEEYYSEDVLPSIHW